MEVKLLTRINLMARCALAFVFIYHGLVPKILWLSPVEAALTNAHQLDSAIISLIAGVFEIFLGLSILLLKRRLMPVYFAGLLLVVLLIDVMLVMPSLLIEAFNPVTINLVSIAMAYLVVITHPYAMSMHMNKNQLK
jgi:hypothetical protein